MILPEYLIRQTRRQRVLLQSQTPNHLYDISANEVVTTLSETRPASPVGGRPVQPDVTHSHRPSADVKLFKDSQLSSEGINYCLDAIGLDPYPIDVPDDIKLSTFRREWMSVTYGGAIQGVKPGINQKRFTHRIDNWHCLNFDYNPAAPRRPGYSGVEINIDYDFHPDRSAAEIGPKLFWCRALSENSWSLPVRIRVAPRREYGRDPTPEEVTSAIQEKKNLHATPEQIQYEISTGAERMLVSTLKCVGYDEDFQRHLATVPGNWKRKTSPKKIGTRKEMAP
ncbi:hypothetical protein M422DRAFT_45103 [Sphaerobolus stellatus SS14]|nr:hypothetical protein M422DRAFT_45103 [Sphaerobolus stellatus SS14]